MAQVSNEPSMEEILSSIKRIIAEEGDAAVAQGKGRKRVRAEPEPAGDEVLELTDAVPADEGATPVNDVPEPPVAEPAPRPADPAGSLVSPTAASASREALASLSMMVVKPEAPGNTLEGLVREMLRPMLKEWLDANLPEVVERLVSREIARITDKGA